MVYAKRYFQDVSDMAHRGTYFKSSPAAAFEAAFEKIYRQKMRELPITRPHLAVRALGFAPFHGHWIGALVTPWSILVVLASGNEQTWPAVQVGKIMPVRLPAGAFHFLGMQEESLGEFLACSLMSPIEPVYRQKDCEAFAAKALALMMTPAAEASKPSGAASTELTRRDFFAPRPDKEMR